MADLGDSWVRGWLKVLLNATVGSLYSKGDITVDGTVDGRDIAEDGTKLDLITVTEEVDLDSDLHTHDNASNLDAIDQDLATTDIVTFDEVKAKTSTIQDIYGVDRAEIVYDLGADSVDINFL